MTAPLLLDGRSLTIADVLEVAEGRRRVRLADPARTRMGTTRGIVEGLAARGEADQYVDEVIDVVRRTLGRPVARGPRGA